jgi:uridylate kinase
LTGRLAEYAEEIKKIHDKGIEIAIVIGGGYLEGVAGASNGMDRVQGDAWECYYQRNGFARCLRDKGMLTRLQTALKEAIAEPYIKRRAVRHLEKGIVMEPEPETLFYTDSSCLRGVEIHTDVI